MRQSISISPRRLADTRSGYIRPVRCYFKLLGLEAGDQWSPYGYMRWVEKRQAEFFAQRVRGRASVLSDEFYQWLEDLVDSGNCPLPED